MEEGVECVGRGTLPGKFEKVMGALRGESIQDLAVKSTSLEERVVSDVDKIFSEDTSNIFFSKDNSYSMAVMIVFV